MKEEFKFAVVQSADANGVMVQFEDDQTPSPKNILGCSLAIVWQGNVC